MNDPQAEGHMASRIGRRKFLATLGGAATAWPLAARAQQPALPVIGFLHTLSPENVSNPMAGFHQGLKEAGYSESQNVAIEYRWAEGHYDRLPALAADLVRRQVAVIAATGGEPSPQVVKAATRTIPIVFMANGDPVASGLVASLNRPGGNMTGVTIFGMMAVGKRLELLRQVMPKAGIIAYLMNPNNPNREIDNVQTAAHSLGQQILVLNAASDREFDTVLATIAQQQVTALLVASDPLFFDRRDQLVALAARQAIPAIYYLRAFCTAGGLLSYGNNLTDMYRQVGIYTGRILKGEKPADLPVIQATKFEFVINLKTAKALGLTMPSALLATADEVIE
jgi:putative tryptophan/tyrosine transport system substrate-binding protein